MKIYNDIDRETFDDLLVKPILEGFIDYVEKEEPDGEVLKLREWTFSHEYGFSNLTRKTKLEVLKAEGYSEEDIKNGKENDLERLLFNFANEFMYEKINIQIPGGSLFISEYNSDGSEGILQIDTYVVTKGRYKRKSENFYTVMDILSAKKYPFIKEKDWGSPERYGGFKDLDIGENKFILLNNEKILYELPNNLAGLADSINIFEGQGMDYEAAKIYLKQMNKQNEDLLDFWNE
ncbi:hypothetical protein [Domibacillus iocasae]|uniref:Uncharacterized protein n=1 Tax=Domibacillus iocasae TaxID=1714016 RepID=A0A1E7DQT3_9BACI|nr:hypothetical protein [Domibacillus iocasae]OES45442.1 hypothetical protein BA724_17470 [Domibacillus iocasae]